MQPPSTGDVCLQAVLIPPQEARLRALFGLGDLPLRADVTGWHKYVVLAADRVFLFPRHAEWVEGLECELAAYALLGEVTAAPAPRLLGRYDDPAIWPYPFGCVSRLPGIPFGSVEAATSPERHADLLEELALLIAAWHEAPLDAVPEALAAAPPPAGPVGLDHGWAHATLQPDRLEEAVGVLHARLRALGLAPPPAAAWIDALRPFVSLDPVLVHGDVHEDQILVADGASLRITGILDWESARVDHPAWDFDFGEWGYGIWEHRAHFPAFRWRMWVAYSARRGLALRDPYALHLYCALAEMAWCLGKHDAGKTDAESLQRECAWRLASLRETT